ncbi:MAG: hypothetical protein BroJett040_09440 [Oligoflexia bacterium]|nr:MAG: hypothetical protein BroJett040_09440 [Oligoflexia bacterium]
MKNNKYLIFAAMGFELGGIILSCIWLGSIIDKQYSLNGLGIAGLSMVGLASWIYHIVILAKRIEKTAEEKNKDE